MSMNSAAPRNESTQETCPRHIWIHEMICAAGVTVEQTEPWRSRLNLWYNTGEPVWMAADSLRFAVRQRAIADRAERDGDLRFIRRAGRGGR